MEANKIITFDSSLKKAILDAFGKTVDDQGYIIEKSDPNQYVLTPNGDYVTLDEFAGLTRGSLRFVKSDIVSLLQFAEELV